MNESTQLALGIDKFHRNEYLFSDHYLDSILRRNPAWGAAQGPAADFLKWLREHYAAEGDQLAAYNEAQLEENWIRPILGRLGHVWESQASVPGLDKTIKKPDYVFFPDDDTRKAAVAEQRTEEYTRRALAMGEVKAWPVSLSHKTAGAPTFANNNPMFQIDYYLKATGVVWGIAANGRFWRLVHKDSSYRLDRYFEIDLLAALNTTDERRALAVATWFTLFFGRAAFMPDETGRVFLDDVLKGSHTYAVALESDLRDNAYKALEQLILGFFAPAANDLSPDDEADRAAVYRNSLLLLYRLLFLFFGESRGLLPMDNDGYRERSLTELARRAAKLVDDHKVDALPPMTGTYWARYKELFAIIDGRDAALNAFLGVPRYNGGLFDPQRHAFLENNFVGERHLVRAIDYLARRRKTENGKFAGYESVDYRTLGVRQLGSIYEGLLEYKVSVAAEEMVTVRKGGKETWLPARERGKTKVIETKQPGELYLSTDKGERKATGSYYTPDYIVKYIVEQTLGPLVEEARRKIRDTKYEIRDAARLFEQEILSLNVLDPAMGSGHFLVDATNYLARALATSDLTTDHGPQTTEPASSSVVRRPSSSSEESDLTYWKRRVVEACIYGVDKNELAVELAKLSLWLETVAADKPLSFLDHHLRHGDSLIGARLADLERAPSASRPDRSRRPVRSPEWQTDPLFDESAFTTSAGLAVGGMAAIEARPTDDLDTVHAKEDAFHIIHDTHLGRWRRLADLWVSAWFGNTMSAEEYRDLALRIQGKPEAAMSDEQAARYLNHPAAAANDYFHWELEFPEVFFDRHGRPKGEKAGFDAVVGNPPYLNAWSMTVDTPEYRKTLSDLFSGHKFLDSELLEGHWDLYSPFIVRALSLTKYSGRHSFIIPNPFLREKYTLSLRKHFLNNVRLETILHFDETNVFDEVSRLCIVYVIEKEQPLSDSAVIVRSATTTDPLDFEQHKVERIAWLNSYNSQIRTDAKYVEGLPLLKKIENGSDFLGQHLYVNVGATLSSKVKGRFDKTVLVTEKPVGNAKQFFTGEDISRWEISWKGEWLDYRNDEMSGPRTPEMFEACKLAIRKRTGENERLIGAYDETKLYCNDTVIICCSYDALSGTTARQEFVGFERVADPVDLEFVLGHINSRLGSWIFSLKFATSALQGTYSDVWPQSIRTFPIRQIRFPQNQELREKQRQQALRICQDETTLSILSIITNQQLDYGDWFLVLVHDILSNVVHDVTKSHQALTNIAADFWTDLEGVTTPAAFRKLRDKGKQEAGLAADPALAPFVRAESKSTRTLDESLAWDEAAFKGFVRALAGPVDNLSRLLRVYHTHAPRARELTDRITRTDHLIDQIVYKLYGLTEEEIAIVEAQT